MANVTVVITLYNEELFIEQAVESVLKQTYSDWQLLIINDASTDHSLERLSRYENNPQITCISFKRNLGQTHALNYALSCITTPYFLQLDADDWLDPRALSELVRAIETDPLIGLAYANHITYWLNQQQNVERTEKIVLEQYKDRYDLMRKMSYAMVPRLYRTLFVRDVGGWLTQIPGDFLAEDVQIALRLATKYKVKWVNDFLYHRRRDPENYRRFEDTRPSRNLYRYNLYNQILREWDDEYRALWTKIGNAYYLKALVPNHERKAADSQWTIP